MSLEAAAAYLEIYRLEELPWLVLGSLKDLGHTLVESLLRDFGTANIPLDKLST